jgi:hypothetical protein
MEGERGGDVREILTPLIGPWVAMSGRERGRRRRRRRAGGGESRAPRDRDLTHKQPPTDPRLKLPRRRNLRIWRPLVASLSPAPSPASDPAQSGGMLAPDRVLADDLLQPPGASEDCYIWGDLFRPYLYPSRPASFSLASPPPTSHVCAPELGCLLRNAHADSRVHFTAPSDPIPRRYFGPAPASPVPWQRDTRGPLHRRLGPQ